MTDDIFFEYLKKECGYTDIKKINPKECACISNFIYTSAIIVCIIGDLYTVGNRWCYHTYQAAKAALDAWDGTGEPKGWHRHPFSGRRVSDTGEEYINP